jgi:hypothetical protein
MDFQFVQCPCSEPLAGRVGSEAQQAVAVVALGHCSLDNCAFLPDELKALQEECTADRKVSVADVIGLRTSEHRGSISVMQLCTTVGE